MTEIAFTQRTAPTSALLLGSQTAEDFCRANHLQDNAVLGAYKAYTNQPATLAGFSALNHLNSLPKDDRQAVVRLATIAKDESTALAKFIDRYFSEDNINKMNSAVGAASTAAVARFDAFERKIIDYQTALKELWQLSRKNRNGRGPAAVKAKARSKVKRAYAALQKAYAIELNRYSPVAWRSKNKGYALSNAKRGITLATRRPNSPKMDQRIQVANRVEAGWLSNSAKTLRVLGNSALVLDAGLRAKQVSDIHDAGGDWMRESARQLTGFGAGAAAGIYLGSATISIGTTLAASSGLLLSGPIGWAVLGVVIGAGLIVGFSSGSAFDKIGQFIVDKIWERDF